MLKNEHHALPLSKEKKLPFLDAFSFTIIKVVRLRRYGQCIESDRSWMDCLKKEQR